MQLVTAHVKKFKSIDDSGSVPVDTSLTVLVGQNESGKTAFLQALHKSRPVDGDIAFDVIIDYPRKDFTTYEARHPQNPDLVAELTYELEPQEVNEINQALGFQVIERLVFTVRHNYANRVEIIFDIPEKVYIAHLIEQAGLSTDIRKELGEPESLEQLIRILGTLDLNNEETEFLTELQDRFGTQTDQQTLRAYVERLFLKSRVPKFLYFDDYYLLPGKVNLAGLQERVTANQQSKQPLSEEDKTVLGLLRIAGVDLTSLADTTGYEYIKARLESISNSVTDKLFKYWTTNTELEVEFDIRSDSKEQAPYNKGSNLYIRIRNRRHRVTVPFSQRSRGFIWFFSFIVWFDSIKQQLGTNEDLILLLDEPGLNLHALAQEDLLRYIDDLAKQHQILYSTHSPFMVQSDRLYQVRTVEDKIAEGTRVSDHIDSSDQKTLFPLQAALGYTIAQNLFISKRNLLVEGPADLIYLQFFSSALEELGRVSLRDDITVVPAGGLDNVATFIALLRGNKLDLAVLHDYESKPNQRLDQLVKDKLIKPRQLLNYAMFRDAGTVLSSGLTSSDIEDLMSPSFYLELFHGTFARELGTTTILEEDLPTGDRVVNRIERYLASKSIQIRPSGGYNHYAVANYLASHPVVPNQIDPDTLARFEQIFVTANDLFKT